MAVHFAAGLNYGRRTAGGFLNPNAASTVSVWARFGTVQAGPNYQLPYALLDDPAVYTQFVTITAESSANHLDLSITGVGDNVTSFTPVAGQWYYLTWVQSSGGVAGQLFYVNGTKIGSTAFVNRSAWVIGFEMLGNDTFATSDIDLQFFRSWQAALSADEIRAEMQSATVVRTANLFMNTPLLTNLTDISGNGRNWTLVGADSFVTGPTFPSNSSAATATEILATTSLTQDFGDGLYGWYFFTALPFQLVVSFWPFASLSDTLTTSVYYGSPGSLTLFSEGVNVPLEVPTSNADTFYFFVMSSPVQPTVDVVIEGNVRPELDVPIGSIGVNDDGNEDVNGLPLPAAFLSGTTGETLAFAKSVAGEAGTVFPPTGQVCLYDTINGEVNIYPAELGTPTVTIPDGTIHSGTGTSVISSDQTTQFYVGGYQSGTTCHVFTLSPTGTIGATDYAVTVTAATSLEAMAPTQTNTILYYANSGNGAAVRRWNLLTNVAMTDFAAGVANHRVVADILCLADGSVIVGYDKPTAATDWFVRRYNAAGSILNTYTFGATNRVNRMAYAIDDPTSFWVWLYLNDDPGTSYGGGTSRFVNVNVADGSVLASIEADNFEIGVLRSAPSADPLRMGHSFSCPFWIQRVGVTPTPDVLVTEYLIRRERWFPVISHEQHRIMAHLLQLYFEAGTGISSGQGSDPICELDWSDDGGHTWSNLHLIKTGKIGEYKRRAIRRMMGQFRERVYRVAVTDPVQWSLIDAFFQATEGTS